MIIPASQLGIKMIEIPKGRFFGGTRRINGRGFKIAEVEFTNGQFRGLMELRPQELTGILSNPKVQDCTISPKTLLKRSIRTAAYPEEAEDCPLVWINFLEAKMIAGLFGLRLLTFNEWTRAAAGTNWRKYSFGEEFDKSKLTCLDRGTRSVYLHRDAATPEGVLDLCGNVNEWTSTRIPKKDIWHPLASEGRLVRGGSWASEYPLPIPSQHSIGFYDSVDAHNDFDHLGVRFAQDL
ncbi:MAG: SUMF1/EgtB/PvdO family nonheme iron enzyme [Candidatus Margulisiibacteriota bacterium]